MVASVERLPGLQALRALAAISVFLVHEVVSQGIGRDIPPVFAFSAIFCPYGVQLFYVVSAFALMHSTRVYEDAPNWRQRYYLKRFWRIAPLFYVIAAAMLIYGYLTSSPPHSPLEIAANVFFINNFWPSWAPSLVFAGWSISVEVLFYCIFPIAFVLIRTLRSAAILLLVSILFSQTARYLLEDVTIPPFGFPYADFSFFVNLQFFAFGIFAYQAYAWFKARPSAPPSQVRLIHLGFAAITAIALTLLAVFVLPLRALLRLDVTLWGAVFALWTVWAAVWPLSILKSAPLQFLGERSYSLYLLHVIVIKLMAPVTLAILNALLPYIGGFAVIPAFAITYVPIVAAATITYALIEKPGMDLGHRLQLRLDRRAVARPSMVGP